MIEGKRLLADLERLRGELEDDLRARCDEDPERDEPFREEYEAAREAGRTGDPYELWRDEQLTQVAVAWILGCVFVRFLEDNGLIDPPRLAGPGERRRRAQDERTLFFRKHPTQSDREYLLHVFREVAALPAAAALFDAEHNPLWMLGPSGDAAGRLYELWQRIDPDTGGLVHDFSDETWDTRFLGDLYQDLSLVARKRYALLQTPVFVEEFILDRTLTPAIEEFGFGEVRLIDPACGSGHFLLGAFHRLDALWAKHEPGTNARERARRTLEQLAGVDVNPFAAAIARFRLLLAALRACEVVRIADAPDFAIQVAVGDSLFHGTRPGALGGGQQHLDPSEDPLRHVYYSEDAAALRQILEPHYYHVVVGNPPYITPKDRALNRGYRTRFGSCHRKYALAVPFTERCFDLALRGETGGTAPAGFVGMITANSFMKREFGKKLIEQFLPNWDLTHVVDTSGAYIPGHGTPTVLLFGRHRRPVHDAVRAVMGIRGEPATPDDPAAGRVWSAILAQIDRVGSQSEFVSVADVPRQRLHEHPWSLGGGGAAELKEQLESTSRETLSSEVDSIGFASFTGMDDAFVSDERMWARIGVLSSMTKEFVYGEALRDWGLRSDAAALVPYDEHLGALLLDAGSKWGRHLWSFRTTIGSVVSFGGRTRLACGDLWWTWYRWVPGKYRTPLSIAFAEVATHNHFVLDRGGKVFNRSAPVIKLPAGASEDDHLALLGLLNSSTACFWMKQVFHNKGRPGAEQTGADEPWEHRFEFDCTKLQRFPISEHKPLRRARELDQLGRSLVELSPRSIVGRSVPVRAELDRKKIKYGEIQRRMVALQEELDWEVYFLYGLTGKELTCAPGRVPSLCLGNRAFEIALARELRAGSSDSTWLQWHGVEPETETNPTWPEEYVSVVEERLSLIESDRIISMIEQPTYKRRWYFRPWDQEEQRALRSWLLDRLEAPPLWAEPRLTTTARLADRLREDAELLQVAELYTGRVDFDLAQLVAELVEGESVPLLATLRYKPATRRKRGLWNAVWELQRREDAIDARTELSESHAEHLSAAAARAEKARRVGEIPVPPKYTSADFQKGVYWRLRGKLDVPKERFVSLPYCERAVDPSLVIGWAGWNALEQSRAVAAYFVQMKEQEGWSAQRLTPLLGALRELLPWVKQWHNELDPEFGVGMGDYFAGFLEEEARALFLTEEAIDAWTPPQGRRPKRAGKPPRGGGAAGARRSRPRRTSR